MTTRLVLGSGPLLSTIAPRLTTGSGDVVVVAADARTLDAPWTGDVRLVAADPTDAAALADLAVTPATVLVASAGVDRSVAILSASRETFDAAVHVAAVDASVDAAGRNRLAEVADDVVAPGPAILATAGRRLGAAGRRRHQLRRVLDSLDGPLAIVTHDNPDPDAIASGVALATLARHWGHDADVCYFGEIAHQENRAFVNVLDLDLHSLGAGTAGPDGDGDFLADYGGVALVDHSRPGVNDQLPPDTPIDVVVDHHPPRAPVEARFVDLRSEAGATSTLMTEYLDGDDLLTGTVASALLFGIRVDTREFRREVGVQDFEAAAVLAAHADLERLARIEDPSVTAETLETLGTAIDNRRREGSVLLSSVGETGDRDALAQAADQLLDLEGISTTLVYGVIDGTIYASARARGADVDLGETLRAAFGQIGSAGGHADMAGAQITLGILQDDSGHVTSIERIVEDVVADRFLEALEDRSGRLLAGVYDPTAGEDYTGA